jgi:hypothetical protein
MSAKTLTDIRDDVRKALRDEALAEYDFTDDELDGVINSTLVELSEAVPFMAREAVHVTSGTKQIDTGGIDDLLEVEEVEYPIDLSPVSLLSFKVIGDTVVLTGMTRPDTTEDIYLHCRKVHTLTDADSTLKAWQERILAQGAAGYAAMNWCNATRTRVKEALALTMQIDTAVSAMTPLITKATDDLTVGRTFINKVNVGGKPQDEYGAYAGKDLESANAKLEQAGGYGKEMTGVLSTVEAIKDYEGWASNQIALFKKALRQYAVPRVGREWWG